MPQNRKSQPIDTGSRLTIEKLNHRVDPRLLPFETTNDLEVLGGVIEQERALEALETGLKIRKRNFNIYISGASGTGKSSILKGLIEREAAKLPPPPDWCLVFNFKRPENPLVLSLPAGKGTKLRTMMDQFVHELRTELPKAFHSQHHQERIQRILNEGIEKENKGFATLSSQAEKNGFQVKHTKDGLVTIPVIDEKPVSTKEYHELSAEQRAKVDSNRQHLEPVISRFLEDTRNVEISVHKKIQQLQKQLGKTMIDRALRPVKTAFRQHGEVKSYLAAVQTHILDNLPRFLPDESDRSKADRELLEPLLEYQVNLLVDNSEAKGGPIVIENTPTYHNLVGKIEKRVENGIYSTNFTMVKPGALLKANGGFLVLHIREVLTYPFAWEALKGVLRYQKLMIEEMGEHFQFLPTTGLRPDPIPVSCKVILIGTNWLYHLLCARDEEFSKAFQVKAEFDSSVRVNPETLMEYARFVATTSRRDNLLPVDRDGVAAIIEFGMRKAGSADQMTLRFNEITNLLIEADMLAREDGRTTVQRNDILRARTQRDRRNSLIADKSLEDVLDGTLRIDTEGNKVGIINGLAVYSYADMTFGRPLRLTAKAFRGKAGVINVERESRLSGNTFNKGVMIISGFLGARFAQKRPISLSVSLTVEQSYGMIDGDSASCAELAAILSALADVPIRQDLAITGSVSQEGEIQAIGGVNEKIEGFFRLCKARGLTGTQGVIIPKSNVRHLILDPEVLEAASEGKFHIHAVESVESAIEILTGIPAGTPDSKGEYDVNSVFGKAAKRLAQFDDSDRKKTTDKGTGTRKSAQKQDDKD